MQSLITSLPGYKVFEYSLVLAPHQDLCNKIMHIKDDFAKEYKTDCARWNKPYVSLLHFRQIEMMEDKITNNFRITAMGYPAFKVALKDFGSFPSHSIYINITSKLPIQNLVKQIRTASQRLLKFDEDHKPFFMMEPTITIGRKLKPWQYEKGWLAYSNKHVTAQFIADGMLLLKRPVDEPKYQIIKEFKFQNLPIATVQGQLFG